MKKIVLIVLLIFVSNITLFAADVPSEWAEKEIDQALELGFVPEDLQNGYSNDITRADFCSIAMQFIAMQYDYKSIDDFLLAYEKMFDETTKKIDYSDNFFNDVSIDSLSDETVKNINSAFQLGIVAGRGDGIFDPESIITRQEAAIMLKNAYEFYADTIPEIDYSLSSQLTDWNDVSTWAADCVLLMYKMDIMQGVGENSFSPLSHYTKEQCISTFLRLYEGAPVSKGLNNIEPLGYLRYAVGQLKKIPMNAVFTEYYLEDCVVVQYTTGAGTMHPSTVLAIIYINGESKNISAELPRRNAWGAAADVEIEFNEDRTKMYLKTIGNVMADKQHLEFEVDIKTGEVTALTEYTEIVIR